LAVRLCPQVLNLQHEAASALTAQKDLVRQLRAAHEKELQELRRTTATSSQKVLTEAQATAAASTSQHQEETDRLVASHMTQLQDLQQVCGFTTFGS
jgi:hypothetical protein